MDVQDVFPRREVSRGSRRRRVDPRAPVRALFVCSQNRLRSPTAEQIFSGWPLVETASAGIYDSAETPLNPELIEWATIIFAMERIHREKLSRKFTQHLNAKRIVVLGIRDDYEFMDAELVRILEAKVEPYLRANRPQGARHSNR